MDGRDLSTRFAVRALDFAETFKAGLGAMELAPGAYVPEMMAPGGPSTGGGVQMVQHIRLVPARRGFPVLVVGSANQRTGQAELRSFGYVDAIHRERFQRGVALDRADYEDFLHAARNFFEANHLHVTVVAEPEPDERRVSTRAPAAPPGQSQAFVLLMGVLIGLVVAILALGAMYVRGRPALPRPADATGQPASR